MINYIMLLWLLLLSVISDLKVSKIRNIYVFPAMVVGIVANTYLYGYDGLRLSLYGVILPLLTLGMFFLARLIGAGDIKLFGAIGALMGWKFVLYAMAYTFVFAGTFAVVSLVREAAIRSTFSTFYQDIKMCFFTLDVSFLHSREKKVIRLSPAIAAGSCLQILLSSF